MFSLHFRRNEGTRATFLPQQDKPRALTHNRQTVRSEAWKSWHSVGKKANLSSNVPVSWETLDHTFYRCGIFPIPFQWTPRDGWQHTWPHSTVSWHTRSVISFLLARRGLKKTFQGLYLVFVRNVKEGNLCWQQGPIEEDVGWVFMTGVLEETRSVKRFFRQSAKRIPLFWVTPADHLGVQTPRDECFAPLCQVLLWSRSWTNRCGDESVLVEATNKAEYNLKCFALLGVFESISAKVEVHWEHHLHLRHKFQDTMLSCNAWQGCLYP